ncbi:DUF6326 family protein [Cytophagaceae bacterium DM2B3-1]|uniref:DUF6326 family protein n=1 Tax=Xanthocytophaga flava TaxID=3048013 RepID=A0ABT7CTW3_9BACT|nr:DUF6326 family protein [Xanthocytophaga flavus]MDJ1497177.1 DUF6326 family protein [Xanthocytophaga flavus]
MHTHTLQDFQVNVRIKLAALWTTVMFCYVYGDFFSLFVPGRIKHLMEGQSGVGTTTPISLLCFSLLMTVPSLMIFLSLVLKPQISRWFNLVFGIFFTLIMTLILITTNDTWMIFYSYLAVVEIVLTGTIVWYAWTWPRQQTQDNPL